MEGYSVEVSEKNKEVILELARNVLRVSFREIDTTSVNRAKDRVIDVIGCLIAGANASGCSGVRSLLTEWGGKKESTILVYGGRIPAHNAAMMNSIMARSYDFEPVGPFVDGKNTPGHVSGTTIPTAIAMAEQRGLSGKDLLTALILGDDMAARLNAASEFSLDQGWDCVGTVNKFGSTAIAGRLAGLDERQMVNAFGIVVNQLGGTMQTFFDGVHAFKLVQGFAAWAGIFSVALAEKGLTGDEDPLFSKYGYFPVYSKSYEPTILTKSLGKAFYSDNTFKPYPCCRANHASIDGALELVRSKKIKPEDIEEIFLVIPAKEYDFAVGKPFCIRQVPQIDASFNLQYCIADAFLRGSVKVEHFSEEAVRDPGIAQMIKKIRLTKLSDPQKFLASRITVKTKSGRKHEAEISVPKGDDAFTPLTAAEKKEKFMNNVAYSKTVPMQKAERALTLLERLEEVDNIAKIARLLVL